MPPPFAILSTDLEGLIVSCNRGARACFGASEEELLGRPVLDLLPDCPGDDGDGRVTARRLRGSEFPALVNQRRVLGTAEELLGRLYVVEDRSEREQLEEQLQHAERLSMLGKLAPQIAHQFKVPLQLISGYTSLASKMLDQENLDGTRNAVDSIDPAIETVRRLVQELTDLGRPSTSAIEDLDLGAEMRAVLETLRDLGVVKSCVIETQIADDLPPVRADRQQLRGALQNLIVNAADAMAETRRRELRVEVQRHAGGGAACAIVDSGPGMPAEVLAQIFEPFYTTKPKGRGTGLGLPIVRSALDRMSATIEVASEPGHGTRFDIAFPPPQRASGAAA